jgi:hypothetical protein
VFGGVNVLMYGDWWQLKPVGGTWLCCNPLDIPAGRAQNALEIFWGEGNNTIRRFWQFTQLLRCKDPWYNEFLQQCRQGELTADMYSFLHGLPTMAAANPCCACNSDVIHDTVLGHYKRGWADSFCKGHKDMPSLIAETECEDCAVKRAARVRVLHNTQEAPETLKKQPFSNAPALFTFNVPRYLAILIRAREFARESNVELTWCYAKDQPLHPGDCDLPQEALDQKRERWLTRHDQDTCNLTSVLPLAVGMPMRLTDSVDRDLHLYRGRRVLIHGWTLDPSCLQETLDGEILLDRLPLVVYIFIEGAKWQIGKLPVGVYPMTPRTRTWKVNKYTGIEAKRTGYLLLPDFASTAHMIQGASLEAAFYDGQDSSSSVSMDSQVAAYVCLSRIKEMQKLGVLQAFSPWLFKQGPPKAVQNLSGSARK